MKSLPIVLALAGVLAACAATKTTPDAANPPITRADVEPPQCGLAPKLPPSVANNPGFTRAGVVVGFLLAPSGEIRDVRLVKPSGYAALDDAVLRQVRLWRCPGTPSRTLVTPVQLPLEFKAEPPEQSDVGRR